MDSYVNDCPVDSLQNASCLSENKNNDKKKLGSGFENN